MRPQHGEGDGDPAHRLADALRGAGDDGNFAGQARLPRQAGRRRDEAGSRQGLPGHVGGLGTGQVGHSVRISFKRLRIHKHTVFSIGKSNPKDRMWPHGIQTIQRKEGDVRQIQGIKG